MKNKLLIAISLFCFISTVSAENISFSLTGEGSEEKIPSGLTIRASVKNDKVVLEFKDGKLKYGVHNIVFKKGDITFTRPRLTLHVPLEKAKAVTEKEPYEVVKFSHDGTPYKIELINSGQELPDIVITKI